MKQDQSDSIIKCPFCGRSFCENEYWESVNTNRMCMVCGYTWQSRGKSIPRRCPSCRSTEWNVSQRKEVSCVKCGHRWVPHRGVKPHMCPKCKSKYWEGDPPKPPKLFGEDDLQHAISLYTQGNGCVDIARETGVPLEAIVLKIRSISNGPVRMGKPRR